MEEKAKELIRSCEPEKSLILSHADHDGYTADALLNSYFKENAGKAVEIRSPGRKQPYHIILSNIKKENPEYLFIVDCLIGKFTGILSEIADSGTKIINLDHHDPLDIEHDNFLSLNPHLRGKSYVNSSGLVWNLLRDLDQDYFDGRAWLAGIGAACDYCFHDQKELFRLARNQGFIEGVSFSDIFSSKLLRGAKTILSGVEKHGREEVYEIIEWASLENEPESIFESNLLKKAYSKHQDKVDRLYKKFKSDARHLEDVNLVTFDLKGERIGFISDICEREKEEVIYMGYSGGQIGFRAPFAEENVKELAEKLGGGGPHPKVGGAKLNKPFKEAVSEVKSKLKCIKEQRDLTSF